MPFQLVSTNFQTLKASFKTDTGLDPTPENMGLYIQYFHAKIIDYQMQNTSALVGEVGRIRSELEVMRQNIVAIKQKIAPI